MDEVGTYLYVGSVYDRHFRPHFLDKGYEAGHLGIVCESYHEFAFLGSTDAAAYQ
jgi:hypothetical protein